MEVEACSGAGWGGGHIGFAVADIAVDTTVVSKTDFEVESMYSD